MLESSPTVLLLAFLLCLLGSHPQFLRWQAQRSHSSPPPTSRFPLFDMATDANETRNHNPSAADNDDTISAALKTQLSIVTSFERWLARRAEVDGDRDGIVSKVQKRLVNYRQWLIRQEAGDITEDDEPWAMGARSGDDDPSAIAVTGPGSGASVEIVAKDDKDMEYLMSVCRFSHMLH